MVIVSSGAIGVGCLRLGLKERPSAIAQKQALAAVGQVHLMRYYEDFFSAVGLVLTPDLYYTCTLSVSVMQHRLLICLRAHPHATLWG